MYARHDGRIHANPDIIADDCISLYRQLIQPGCYPLPSFRKDAERIGCYAIHFMIGPIHNELHTRGNHTKLTNDQSVTNKIIVILHVFLEIQCILKIIIVGVITYNNIGIGNDIFEEAEFHVILQRKRIFFIFIRSACCHNAIYI